MDTARNVTVVADPDVLAETAAQLVVDIAAAAVDARGRFTLVLAGGATPRATYERLALPPFCDQVPWKHAWIFFGDERAVAPDHPEANYHMAFEALLSRVRIPSAQVCRIPADADDTDAAAADYARMLACALDLRRGELPRFDLVILGVGVDGHTASLFPGSPVLREVSRPVAAVHAAAAAIPERITLTLPAINAAAHVLFLAAGAEKAKVVRAALAEQSMLPAAMVHPANGKLTWLLDRAAASLLDAPEAR